MNGFLLIIKQNVCSQIKKGVHSFIGCVSHHEQQNLTENRTNKYNMAKNQLLLDSICYFIIKKGAEYTTAQR